MVRESDVQRSLHPQYHAWGFLEQGTEPPTAPRAPQHKWLPTAPGVCSRCVCVCVHCCVCALWMGQMQSTNSEYGSPYLVVCHVTFTFSLFKVTLQQSVCVVSEVNMVIPLQRSLKQNNISMLWVVLTASTTGPGLFLRWDILFSSSCTLVLGVHH